MPEMQNRGELSIAASQSPKQQEMLFSITHVPSEVNKGRHDTVPSDKLTFPRGKKYSCKNYFSNVDSSLLVPIKILGKIDQLFDMLDSNQDNLLTRADFENKLMRNADKLKQWAAIEKFIRAKNDFLRNPSSNPNKLPLNEVSRTDFKNYFVHTALEKDPYDSEYQKKDETMASILENLRDCITANVIREVNNFIDENKLDESFKINVN
jgi:hypothetical protein